MAWLTDQSMLADATEFAKQFSGQGSMWQNPFADPDPRAAIEKASVWFTAYPISMITKPGSSFLGTLGGPRLWEAFAEIGIDGVHTGPVKKAGGLEGWDETPSVDGHFDRISTHIDEAFGTEDEFRSMCEVAAEHGGTIIDDIVPGHTGKGADFRLAEMKVGDYPGIYHMVEIPEHDWHLLPKVSRGQRFDQPRLRGRRSTGEGRLHHRAAAAGDLPRPGDQGHQLERHRRGARAGRGRAPVGLPALLQGGSALDQLAGSHLRRDAAGHR